MAYGFGILLPFNNSKILADAENLKIFWRACKLNSVPDKADGSFKDYRKYRCKEKFTSVLVGS